MRIFFMVIVSGLITVRRVIMGSPYMGIGKQPCVHGRLLEITWRIVISSLIVTMGKILIRSELRAKPEID